MDYRQKMVLAPNKTRITVSREDDDDEDLEALRMAALQSLRAKDPPRLNPQSWPQTNRNTHQITQPYKFYKEQRQPAMRSLYQTSAPQRNGGVCFQRHNNPNLIAIVPVEKDVVVPKCEPAEKLLDRVSPTRNHEADESKFCRYKDDASCSEEEDDGDRGDNVSDKPDVENRTERGCPETLGVELSDVENASTHDETPEHSEEDEKEEDDDDVLLMADLEEEDSLERLMDEMEKEMSVDKPTDMTEKRHSKKESKSARRVDTNRRQTTGRTKPETRKTNPSSNLSAELGCAVPAVIKNEGRPVSPYNRPVNRRRSLSPKPRSRKKSPRKSPRRSPPRQFKKSLRDGGGREPLRYRSPRKSPFRFSPRPRSPRLSPRRSSPRLSPRLSPYHRSPCRIPRSRSPRMSPRPRSPRLPRSRSPRSPLRRSPARLSPRKLSPRLAMRSPKLSPRRTSPRARSPRLSPRPRSPRISPRRVSPRPSPRRLSPRTRSPLRRLSPRARSPGLSPHRSPWSSPRNSPHLSPRRRRSPKELTRKVRPLTPVGHQSPILKRGCSPNTRVKNSPDDFVKTRLKQKDEIHEKVAVTDMRKGTDSVTTDPVLEARRRKFESVKPIDPINANKKIKLSRNESRTKKLDVSDETQVHTTDSRTEYKVNEEEEYETIETDSYLGADFEFEEDVEDPIEDSPAATIASAVNVCSEIEPAKLERERPVKKKKKKDKELYQVHKSKGELPLSERIGKEKKCKKRKEVSARADSPVEKTETIFEDLTVDEEEGDLRTELSRRRAERLNRTAPIHQQSVRLVQSAFKGVVSEVVKSNAKSIRKQLVKGDDKQNHKEVRRVTVLHRPASDLHESEDETTADPKVPVRFRLGLNKAAQDTRESKASRKTSKRQSRKVKHKSNLLSSTDGKHPC